MRRSGQPSPHNAPGPTAVTAGGRGVWVSNEFDGRLVRIDPRTNQVAQRLFVGSRLHALATSDEDVLVAVRGSGVGHRGGVLRVRMTDPVDSIDTAAAYGLNSAPIVHLTNDGLVAYDHTSGLAGTQLVPDLAVALPAPTDGGTTYTFRLRPNIRYSNGRPVRASDFRTAFERDFAIGKLYVQYYDGIVGADRCRKDPRHCDLSRGIVANDTARTVAFHLVAPDAEFLHKLTLSYADATPAREARAHPLPASGPYMIASYRPGEVRLTRNPYFHEWSKAAQPDGYPNEIVFETGGSADRGVADVLDGTADVFSSALSSQPLSARILETLKLRHASQVHSNPQPGTFALFLNTRVPPFDRVEARRAMNYAADRAAAVRVVGGPDLAQPTCQVLPPGFPGYRRYCPYGSAPSLAKARALVARSGTRGMHVTYWSFSYFDEFAPYAVALLRSLGYRVSTKTIGDEYYDVVGDSCTGAQIGLTVWISDYPAPSAFVNALLSCAAFLPKSKNNLNVAAFCDPRLDRRSGRALGEQVTNPYAARGVWERVDRRIVDEAPWVPLVNPKSVDVLSRRVGNYQYSANGLGMLLDQLWVR
jgi:peptide/nickel transport system substrate-binding protein